MAMAALYLKGIAPPHVTLAAIFNGVMPYLALIILAMVIVYNVPATVYWLPSILYGR